MLYGELEKVFFRNHRKLDVTCIVERDLYGHQLAANPSVREAAPDFKIGTLAAIAGVTPELNVETLSLGTLQSEPGFIPEGIDAAGK